MCTFQVLCKFHILIINTYLILIRLILNFIIEFNKPPPTQMIKSFIRVGGFAWYLLFISCRCQLGI